MKRRGRTEGVGGCLSLAEEGDVVVAEEAGVR